MTVQFPLEALTPYRAGALAALAVFYGIYFTKMMAQKRRGIRTHQIGRRKEKTLHTVETLMSVATFGIVPVQLLSIAMDWNHMPPGGRFTGLCTAALGDLIFLVSVLCMRDSWRAGIPETDRTELVTGGIYAWSRNPAFLGFDLQYLGVFLMFCNPLTGLFTVFAAVMLHLQILQEERYMAATFGEPYLQYKRRVFRYLGARNVKGAEAK